MLEFSNIAQKMRSSEIRRLMKLAADPSVISFAGGMPANTLLPTNIIDELYSSLSIQAKQAALQYGPTSGYPPLLDTLMEYLKGKGLPTKNQSLLVTTGAQQAINILTKVFIDPGDTIITETPSFIGALAAFKSYGARLLGVPMDNKGIQIDQLQFALESEPRIKIVYLSPYFHNPAGIIYSPDRKKDVLKLLNGKPICLLEDDPYGELYFDDKDKELTKPMKAMCGDQSSICYIGSFSKIFGPGLRLGWILGPTSIIEKCELAKQSMDACSPLVSQVLAHEYLVKGKLHDYVSSLRTAYAQRAKVMLDALDEHMPSAIKWTRPKGGFYIWVTLPESIDASAIFTKSIKNGAAFVIGNAFDPDGIRNNCFRLAFSHTPESKIAEGIHIIASAITSELGNI